VFGLPAIAGDLEQLSAGRADAEVLDRIATRSATVEGRGGAVTLTAWSGWSGAR